MESGSTGICIEPSAADQNWELMPEFRPDQTRPSGRHTWIRESDPMSTPTTWQLMPLVIFGASRAQQQAVKGAFGPAGATQARFGATQRTLKPATISLAATGFYTAAE